MSKESDFVDLLNKEMYELKIADLEAKLAESEKQIKDAREAGNMAVDSWCKNRRKYEAQIAEMQNKSFILYSMLYETLEKQGCENVASQIDQMTGWTYDKEADWLKGNRNYDQLKQQLAESEKKIVSIQVLLSENAIDRKAMQEFKIGEDEYDLTDEDARNSLCWEVKELKQQLHDLPKKIVGEIKEQLFNHFKVKNIEEYEKLSLIDSLFTLDTVIEILDTILKKYGGEDE